MAECSACCAAKACSGRRSASAGEMISDTGAGRPSGSASDASAGDPRKRPNRSRNATASPPERGTSTVKPPINPASTRFDGARPGMPSTRSGFGRSLSRRSGSRPRRIRSRQERDDQKCRRGLRCEPGDDLQSARAGRFRRLRHDRLPCPIGSARRIWRAPLRSKNLWRPGSKISPVVGRNNLGRAAPRPAALAVVYGRVSLMRGFYRFVLVAYPISRTNEATTNLRRWGRRRAGLPCQ